MEKRLISTTMIVVLIFFGVLLPSNSLSDINDTVLSGKEFLEEGFPIFIPLQAGTSIYPDYMKVANIDSDNELEIILKPLNNELCAWNHDGTIVSGWPLPNTYMEGGFILGEFDKELPGLEIFYGFASAYVSAPPSMAIYSGSGSPINGWPSLADDLNHYLYYQPTATDLDNDGIDELVIRNKIENEIAVFRADGSRYEMFSPPPIPTEAGSGAWGEYASGDINGDGYNEIIATYKSFAMKWNECYRYTSFLFAYKNDGSMLDGFPIQFYTPRYSQPLLTDVNGDNIPEIILLSQTSCSEEIEYNATDVIKIIDGNGSLLNQIFIKQDLHLTGPSYHPFYYLGDLDNDEKAEILFITEEFLSGEKKLWAYKTDGTVMPGWPVEADVSGIAIGDIDGDKLPEVVIITDEGDPNYGFINYLVVYENNGCKKDIIIAIDYMCSRASWYHPVIADLDNDGRNEVIVLGDYWNGTSGYFPQIWAFDFGGDNHGAIQFGQYGVDIKNSKLLVPPPKVLIDDWAYVGCSDDKGSDDGSSDNNGSDGGGGSGGGGCFLSTVKS